MAKRGQLLCFGLTNIATYVLKSVKQIGRTFIGILSQYSICEDELKNINVYINSIHCHFTSIKQRTLRLRDYPYSLFCAYDHPDKAVPSVHAMLRRL